MRSSLEKPLYWFGLPVANNVLKQKRYLFPVRVTPRGSAGLRRSCSTRPAGTRRRGRWFGPTSPPPPGLPSRPSGLGTRASPLPPPKEIGASASTGDAPRLGYLSVWAVVQHTDSDRARLHGNVFLTVPALGIQGQRVGRAGPSRGLPRDLQLAFLLVRTSVLLD